MTNNNILAVGAGICLFFIGQASQADFALNWAPDQVNRVGGFDLPNINCNRGEGQLNCQVQSGNTVRVDPDPSPFLQERVRDPDTGEIYYHVILGLPSSDFAQEVFIRANSGVIWGRGFIQVEGTSSGGTVDFAPPTGIFSASQLFDRQFPLDEDENISGNSTANPTRVVMRQLTQDAGFTQEFLKDTLLNKPRITQGINDADVVATFVADMRGLNYNDMNTAAPIVNTLSIMGEGATTFDMATDAAVTDITAGQYRWLPGTGPDQSSGTYEYLRDSYNPYLEDWKSFRDPNQNLIKNE